MRYIDLHCHPTLMLMNDYSKGNPHLFNGDDAHAWSVPKANSRKLKKGLRATNYTQATFAHQIKANTRMVFATLYAFEQGFFIRKDGLPRSTAIVAALTHVNIDRAKWILRKDYNYWEEFKAEYTFIRRRSGVLSDAKICFKHPTNFDSVTENVSGRYWLIADNPNLAYERMQSEDADYEGTKNYAFKAFDELGSVVENNTPEVAVMLCVEGSHIFTLNRDERNESPVSETEMWQRVDALKNLDPFIFYYTPSHHFNNTLISHAHSFSQTKIGSGMSNAEVHKLLIQEELTPDEIAKEEQLATIGIDLEPNQLTNMNYINDGSVAGNQIGMKPLGERLLLELLHLQNNNGTIENKNVAGRRILIDVKHMSAKARQEFYTRIIRPFNENKPLEAQIPVIASHVAYGDRRTLQEMIDNYGTEGDNSTVKEDGTTTFMQWNINLSDEDVQTIVASGGLIGISFDQRILGVPYEFIRDDLGVGRDKFEAKIKWDRLITNNIYRFVKAVPVEMQNYHAPHSIWKCLAIGSDFDGGVDPVNCYSTATDFGKMRGDVVQFIKSWQDLADFGLTVADIEQVAEDICFNNAYNFVKRVYPTMKIALPA